MESWLHDELQKSVFCYLQGISNESDVYSTPCLMYYHKGLFYLHPLKIFDVIYDFITENSKSSLLITELKQDPGNRIILKGEIREAQNNHQIDFKRYWLDRIQGLSAFFDTMHRFQFLNLKNGILAFTPNEITAWKGSQEKPITISMEII